MNYQCILTRGKRKEKWDAEIRMISVSSSFYEANITGRGSFFHLIVGKHSYGNFLCIPNMDIGSELSSYGDVFWNMERLSQLMGKVDAATVAYGLSHLEEAFTSDITT